MYERSNIARRKGVWPERSARVEWVRNHLRDPAAWFLVAIDDGTPVGMASAEPLLGEGKKGPPIPGGCFVNLIFVLSERWGEGIGGTLLDAVLAEAKRRGSSHIRLWTEEDNERSHRLYRSRGFSPTGRVGDGAGEWALEL